MKHKLKAKAVGRGGISRPRLFLLLLLLIPFGFIVAAGISILLNGRLTTAYYELGSEKIKSSFRIALISDLHRESFGENNADLVALTAGQEPDIICVDGDMLEKSHTPEEDDALVSLIERLSAVAPIYMAAGNHDYIAYCVSPILLGPEYDGMAGRSELTERLEAAGAVFLESDYEEIEVNGNRLRIGGFYPFAFRSEYDSDGSWEVREEFLSEYCDTDSFKLMLSHRPDTFIYGDAGSAWDIDLVLSGHTHNGVIALPFGLGAIWTSEGWFPKYDRGEFELGSMTMIISSGFSGNRGIPRVFNPPELVFVDVKPVSVSENP